MDTRKITKKIRNEGTVKCVISTEGISIGEAKRLCDEGSLRGDWMKEAATEKKYVLEPLGEEGRAFNVAVLDFGVKGSILKSLRERGCRLTVYPYGTKAEEILETSLTEFFSPTARETRRRPPKLWRRCEAL